MGTEQSTYRNAGPAESFTDTSKLPPRVKKWLTDTNSNKYTSYSVPKGEHEDVAEQRSPTEVRHRKTKSETSERRDPELVALDNINLFSPLFHGSKTKDIFPLGEKEYHTKKMFVADMWPILLVLQDFQTYLNESGNQINTEQVTIGRKIEEKKLFCVKVLHNLASLGSDIQNLEQNLQHVHALDQGLKVMQEKLKSVVKKTFNLLDLIPEEDRMDIVCPLDVSTPYLRKDQYTSINLFANIPFFISITPEERDQMRVIEDNWLQNILPHWENLIQNSTEKKNYFWREGIPFRLRGHVWKKLIPNKLNITPELYMELQLKAHHTENNETQLEDPPSDTTTLSTSNHGIITISPQTKSQKNIRELIRRDLPRTFPEFKLFKNPESDAYNQILKVLETAAYYQPEIGYVQGMSYVAATLLLFMNHYDAFVCFANLMNTPFMRSVTRVELAYLAKHSQLFQIIFAQYAPELYEHFNNLNITTEHFLLDWWLTLFSKSVSLPLACHIWDCFLIEGEIFVHYVAVGALRLFSSELKKASFEECLVLVTEQIPKKLNESSLFSIIKEFNITPKIHAIMEEMGKEHVN